MPTATKAKRAKTASPKAKRAKPASKPPVAKAPTPSPAHDFSHNEIAVKAYEIWLEKGRPIGQDDLNWQEAITSLSKTP